MGLRSWGFKVEDPSAEIEELRKILKEKKQRAAEQNWKRAATLMMRKRSLKSSAGEESLPGGDWEESMEIDHHDRGHADSGVPLAKESTQAAIASPHRTPEPPGSQDPAEAH